MGWNHFFITLGCLGSIGSSELSFAQTSTEKKVNEHLFKTHQKIELEKQKREVELLKENRDAQPDPVATPPVRKGFVEKPTPLKKDPDIVSDHYNPQEESNDPAYQAQREVTSSQDAQRQQELEQRQFIEEFKRRAKESGVNIEIDPKTLKANPK